VILGIEMDVIIPNLNSIKKVFDDRQIDKSSLGWDADNYPAPYLIGPIAPEALAHQIRIGMNSSIAIVDESAGVSFPPHTKTPPLLPLQERRLDYWVLFWGFSS